ncbi:MAG: hypothetical protein IKD18_06240 [Clostridia bacterium]|nr:hypothetical protein [Clostridia bacterium]
MSRYIPYPPYVDRMPVDISAAFGDEKPAGKHGFLRAEGEVFRFEDGTPGKFWGVNFNGGACFPDHDYAHKVAARLSQAGCNVVRFHQLDAQWDTPNIFAFTKGKRLSSTRALDPKSMEALDYLIYALKEEGIYCYLDMLTYRHFKEEDGVETYHLLQDKGRPWCIIDPKMIQLQKEFCTQIWEHYNPYTGLCYKDDPVFILTEIVNEEDLFVNSGIKKSDYNPSPYHENLFREMFRHWLTAQELEYDWQSCDLYAPDDALIRFKIDATEKYYDEMYAHLRSIGVKIPITGTNWIKTAASTKAEEKMDFTDGHHYFYDWKWGNRERSCMNRGCTAAPYIFPNLGKRTVAGKPFFVSEWDMPWPNAYRAEGALYYASVGALQNWSGFTVHTYAYSCLLDKMDVLGRELSSPVAGVPYREGIFSVWNDPAKFGLFYHAALITRRGDVSPANKKYAAYTTRLAKTCVEPFQDLLERSQIRNVFEDKKPEGYDAIIDETERVPREDPNRIESDNGQLWRDLKKQLAGIDTPRTKAVYGFFGNTRRAASNFVNPVDHGIKLQGLSVDCRTDFAVIALSSLTDDPIEHSQSMLLSTIGRARNTGAQFDGEKMLELGHAPITAEVIDATISLKTSRGDKLKVWGVNAEGFYAGQLPTTYENGILTFRVGDEDNPAPYYLIVED